MTQNVPAATENRPTISAAQFQQLSETMLKAQLDMSASQKLPEGRRPQQRHRDLALQVLQTLGLGLRVDDPEEFKNVLGQGPLH